ncbi:MAG: response regulator [Phycisphaerales bacterium]|nr:response regulator [Phycisphaerales bacterium]
MNPNTGHILIADTDPQLTSMLRAHLANSGFSVNVCESGNDCHQYILERKPDVAILDADLPDMGGIEIVRRVHGTEQQAPLPLFMLTGHGEHNDVILGLGAGAQDYVRKPCDLTEITARVHAMYRLRVAQRAMESKNSTLANEVTHKSSRLEMLYRFGRELNDARDAETIYDLVVRTVQGATGCKRISIMRHDAQADRLVCVRAVGIDPKIAEQLSVDPASGIAGQVFKTGNTVVARAMSSDKNGNKRYDSDSFLSTPLVSTYLNSNEQRLGVLNVTDKPDGSPFTPDEIEVLSSIAVSAAIALHNAEQRVSLKHSIRALLLTVGRLSEYRDEETGLHVERVRDYARVLARQLATNPKYADVVTPEFIEDLHQAAPLHDLGKVAIPDEILNKPGKLTDEEFQIMKTHTTIGRHTLSLALEETGSVPLLQMCLDIAYCHHERWDGRGYPRGLSGTDIPVAARIIGLVDAYDAITSQRCYKAAVPHGKTVDIIRNESGKHFDPDIVTAFLEVADEFDRIRAAKTDGSHEIPQFAQIVAR